MVGAKSDVMFMRLNVITRSQRQVNHTQVVSSYYLYLHEDFHKQTQYCSNDVYEYNK